MRLRTLPVFLVLGTLTGAARPADRTHDVTPDDYFSLAAVTQFAVSPDARHVAYCEGRWQQSTDDRKTDLWVVATGEKPVPRRLTFDRANDRNPKWSADGKSIFFLGNRKRGEEKSPPYDGKTQVWQIDLAGGDPRPVTRVEGGVVGYDLAPKAGQLFYTADATVTDDDPFARLRKDFEKVEYGHGKRKVSEVWRLDLTTWREEKVIAEKRYVREFAVTADGKRLAMVTALDDTVIRSEGESRVDVWERSKVVTPPTDLYRANAASPHAWLEDLAWSADGLRFAFCAIFDAYPAEVVVGTRSETGWEVDVLKRPADVHVRGYGSPLKWTADGAVAYLGEARGSVGLVVHNFAGDKATPAVERGAVVYGFDVAPDKTLVTLQGNPAEFPELVVYPPRSEQSRKISNLNPQTDTWKLPTVKHVTWKAKDGSEVGGVLELPHRYERGTKLPLVVAIHGGPTTSVKAEQAFDPHNGRLYFAAKGYAVLCPNYRGSTGYGDKFVTDLVGTENAVDVTDIVAGVKHLIDEGIADPDRVAVMGWSNGGYLTNCLITRTDLPFKLKAASSGAGILDTAMEWGINDEPAYPKVFKKGHPWERPDVYRKTSPSWDLGNVKTPTLIHVGGNDERCPPGHSRMLYRALKEYVGVPAELVVYPGEPHGLTKYANRKAKMEWDLAWFEKYVRDKK